MAVPGTRESVGVRSGPGTSDIDVESALSYAQHFDAAFGRRFAAKALDSLVVVRGARVLDVGCGTGIFARLAAHVSGSGGRVVGIDPSALSIDAARRIDTTSNVEWMLHDMRSLPFDDAYFDVVACQHALHRFDDRVRTIEEMGRVLGPGGRLGITTWGPIEENPAFAVQLDAAVKAGFEESGIVDMLLDAFSIHRSEDLADLAAQAGLSDVSVRTIRMLVALPPAAEWVRIYPTMAPLARAWQECDHQARVQFLARATELLRPFEHDGVLRVQASCRLLVARAPFA